MVKPNKTQQLLLEELRNLVIGIMTDMSIWREFDLSPLYQIELGLLRKNATQRHGVTRWQRGFSRDQLSLDNLEVIELHPELLNEEWSAYAAFVLHHEFIHALGYRDHNKRFRLIENSWPGVNAGNQGPEFTEYLRMRTAKWLWVCANCETKFPRKKPSNGRYRCRKCSTILADVKL